MWWAEAYNYSFSFYVEMRTRDIFRLIVIYLNMMSNRPPPSTYLILHLHSSTASFTSALTHLLIYLSSKTTTANHANPKPAKPDYGRFHSMLLSDWRTAVANELCVQTSIFANCWFQIKQICVIFTHLRLWIAVARHNLKWVKIFF